MATGKPPWSGAFDDQVSALFAIATSESHPPIPEHLTELVLLSLALDDVADLILM